MRHIEHSTRIHGHSFFLEFPGPGAMNNVSNIDWTDQQGFRQGMGVIFRGKRGKDNFFHASVPTTTGPPLYNPFITERVEFTGGGHVLGVSVDFVIAGPAQIFHLALFDGSQRFFVDDRRPSINLRTNVNVPVTPSRGIVTGLGISVGVNFESDDAQITFRGATVKLRTTFFEPGDQGP